MKSPRNRTVLLAIIALSLLLRGAIYVYWLDTALPWFPTEATESDMHATWKWSARILDGDILGRDTYHPEFRWMKEAGSTADWAQWWGNPNTFQQEPLYTYGIALLRWLLPSPLHTIPLLQLLLGGSLLPLAVYALGRQIVGARTALYAAAIAAVFGPEIFYQCAVLRDWAIPIGSAFALALAIAGIRQSRPGWLLGAGLLLGIGAIMKSTALLWLPVCLGWLWLATKSPAGHAQAARSVAALALGFALGISPLIVRNCLVGAPPLAFSNRLQEGLIQGNAADAYPVGLCHPASQEAILKASAGSPAKVIGGILQQYRESPGAFFRIQGLKLLAAFSPADFTDNLSYNYGQQRLPPLRICPSWGMLLALAIPGLVLLIALRKGRALWVSGILVAHSVALLLPIALGRYRLEALPLLAVGAAQTIQLTVVYWHSRRWNRLALSFGFVAALVLLSHAGAGLERFRRLAGTEVLPWTKLQLLALPNRIVSLRVFTTRNHFIAAADESADLAEAASRYEDTRTYVGQAHNSEIRFLVRAAVAASQTGNQLRAAEVVQRARKRVASIPAAERLATKDLAAFLAQDLPAPIALRFAEFLQPEP